MKYLLGREFFSMLPSEVGKLEGFCQGAWFLRDVGADLEVSLKRSHCSTLPIDVWVKNKMYVVQLIREVENNKIILKLYNWVSWDFNLSNYI